MSGKNPFDELRRSYAEDLPERIGEIAAVAGGLGGGEGDVRRALEEIYRLAHKLAGSGATFGFDAIGDAGRRLEALCTAALDGQPSADLGEKVAELLAGMERTAAGPRGSPEAAPDAARAASSGRVLVIDDDASLALYVEAILKSAGMPTAVETDPDRVMERIDAFRPQVILMDLHMPGGGGGEVARAIRARGSRVPIIFLSAEEDPANREEALRAGGGDFLCKPVDPDELIALVTKRLGESSG